MKQCLVVRDSDSDMTPDRPQKYEAKKVITDRGGGREEKTPVSRADTKKENEKKVETECRPEGSEEETDSDCGSLFERPPFLKGVVTIKRSRSDEIRYLDEMLMEVESKAGHRKKRKETLQTESQFPL